MGPRYSIEVLDFSAGTRSGYAHFVRHNDPDAVEASEVRCNPDAVPQL
jgi:hypothetical protein